MKNMLKEAAILFVITVIAGAVLGFIYDMTKEPIAGQNAKAKHEACQEVFEDAQDFRTLDISEEETSPVLAENGYDKVSVNEVMEAVDASGAVLGYVMIVTSHEGYGGDIQFSMGVRMDGTLNGISLLSISETPGLGMRAEEVLKPQFTDKHAAAFTFTKTGAVAEDQIDAISGATITTTAVVNGVNGGLNYFQNGLEGGRNSEQ